MSDPKRLHAERLSSREAEFRRHVREAVDVAQREELAVAGGFEQLLVWSSAQRKSRAMKKRYTEAKIVGLLREADAGLPVKDLAGATASRRPASACGEVGSAG